MAALDPTDVPPTAATWELTLPPGLNPGPTLGRIAPGRRLLHWPRELLGIDWLGLAELTPPACIVVGRMQQEAWIADVHPQPEDDAVSVDIAWDAGVIDPLGCQLSMPQEERGLAVVNDTIRVSDLPGAEVPGDPAPWQSSIESHVLTVRLPRTARATDFGMRLLTADGRLLDQWPVARRFETVEMTISVNIEGEAPVAEPPSVIGDRRPSLAPAQRDAAHGSDLQSMRDAREQGGLRRYDSHAELQTYLRWRLSHRAGDLLIVDPYLLSPDIGVTWTYLASFDRPIRALATPPRQKDAPAGGLPPVPSGIEVRKPPTRKTAHDRLWMVGETVLLLGGSVNTFTGATAVVDSLTTVAEIPVGSTTGLVARFEAWWTAGKKLA